MRGLPVLGHGIRGTGFGFLVTVATTEDVAAFKQVSESFKNPGFGHGAAQATTLSLVASLTWTLARQIVAICQACLQVPSPVLQRLVLVNAFTKTF